MKTRERRTLWLCAITAASLSASTMLATNAQPSPTAPGQAVQSPKATLAAPPEVTEGPCRTAQVTAGPFDIHRKYKSMEGPWAVARFSIGDAIATSDLTIPEDKVHFVENNNEVRPVMNSMSAATWSDRQRSPLEEMEGIIDTSRLPRTLYWLKGFKVEVLNENDKPAPTAEFICHTNVEMDPAFHNKIFPEGDKLKGSRLFTITQGQTSIMFPPGFAMPFGSDEVLRISLQAANRTTDSHRRVKHRATFYFIKDSELITPVTALISRSDFVSMIVDRDTDEARQADHKAHPHCDLVESAVNAPNNVIGGTELDNFGRRRSGHWVVPPGLHHYSSVINENEPTFFNKPRKVRAAWVHVHPYCEHVAITKCRASKAAGKGGPQEFFTADITTNTEPGLTIENIQPHIDKDGLVLPKGGPYQLAARYNNTSGQPVDAMISLGLYLEDKSFARPMWSLPDHTADYCGLYSCNAQKAGGSNSSASDAARTTGLRPLFDLAKDGPLLTEPVKLQVATTAGNLVLVMDPAQAPITVTQITKLFLAGAFDSTRIARHIPGFVLQVGAIDDKVLGSYLKQDHWALNRRLPLEAKGQHHKYCLSMSREQADENSASSSFTILLADAPHMDGKYTVFGHLGDDEETRTTIERITSDWDAERPALVSAKILKSVHTASNKQ